MPQVTGEQTEAAVSHKHRCVYLGGTSPQPPLPAVGQVSRPPEPGFSSLGFCMEHHGAPRLQVQHSLATAPRSGECCQAVWDNLFSAWHTPPDRQEEGAWGAASRGSQRLVWRLPGGSRSTFGRPIPESPPRPLPCQRAAEAVPGFLATSPGVFGSWILGSDWTVSDQPGGAAGQGQAPGPNAKRGVPG